MNIFFHNFVFSIFRFSYSILKSNDCLLELTVPKLIGNWQRKKEIDVTHTHTKEIGHEDGDDIRQLPQSNCL